jgi:hypothetical protein
MVPMPKRYPKDQRDRAVRVVLDRLDEHPSLYADLDALPNDKRWGRYRIRVTSSDLETHIQAITELIALASNGVVAEGEE